MPDEALLVFQRRLPTVCLVSKASNRLLGDLHPGCLSCLSVPKGLLLQWNHWGALAPQGNALVTDRPLLAVNTDVHTLFDGALPYDTHTYGYLLLVRPCILQNDVKV